MAKRNLEQAIAHLQSNDKCLSTLIKKIGNCNLRLYKDHYRFLLDSIISQQLSNKAANAISNRFSIYFDDEITPEKIISSDDGSLRKLGMSNPKVKYIKDLSQKVLSSEIKLAKLSRKSDEEIISELIKVKGIGSWTAHMFLIFSLGRLNVLPVGDLGIKKSIMVNYRLRKLPDEKKIRLISKNNNWEPYNSIACWYLWKSLDLKIVNGTK